MSCVIGHLQAYNKIRMQSVMVNSQWWRKEKRRTSEDILVFAKDAACVSPMGWSEHPSIQFKTECDLPSARTCSNCLYIPTSHWDNYDTCFAVNCSVGFGQV